MELCQRQSKERDNMKRQTILYLILAMTAGTVLVLTIPSYYSITSFDTIRNIQKGWCTVEILNAMSKGGR